MTIFMKLKILLRKNAHQCLFGNKKEVYCRKDGGIKINI